MTRGRLSALRSLLLPLLLCASMAHVTEADENAAPCNVSLSDLLDRAATNNLSLLAVDEQVAQARQAVAQARALYFPKVDASASALFQWLDDSTESDIDEAIRRTERTLASVDSFVSRFRGVAPRRDIWRVRHSLRRVDDSLDDARDRFDEPIENYSLGVNLSMLLFDGFARKHTLAVARLGHRETEAARREAARLLFDAVAESYYAIQLATEHLRVSRSDRDFNARLMKDAETLLEYGKGPYANVLNFRAAAEAAEIQLIMSEGEVEAATMALAALLSFPDVALPESWVLCPLDSVAEADLQTPALAAMLDQAAAQRPDLEQHALQLERSGAEIRRRRGAYYPTVGLRAGYQDNLNLNGGFGLDGGSPQVGVSVSYNIFSGGQRRARVREAMHSQREAEYQAASAEINATLEVKQALLNLRIAQAQYQKLGKVTETVKETRHLTETAFMHGKESLTRLNQAQRDLVRAEGEMAGGRVGLKRAWFQLDSATAKTLASLPGTDGDRPTRPSVPAEE